MTHIDYSESQDEGLLKAYGPLTASARARVAHFVKTFGISPYDAELHVRAGTEPKAVPPPRAMDLDALKAAGVLKRGSDL